MTEISLGERWTNGNWFVCRYTGKIEQPTSAYSQTKIDRTRVSVLCYTKQGGGKESKFSVQRIRGEASDEIAPSSTMPRIETLHCIEDLVNLSNSYNYFARRYIFYFDFKITTISI